MDPLRRVAAVLEVLGVLLAGQLVVTLLTRAFGLQLTNPLTSFHVGISDAELITASRQMFVLLVVQYAGWFLLIVPINWWSRRRGLSAYGLTTAGFEWSTLLLIGAATAVLAACLPVGVQLIDAAYDIGETVPWRQAFFDTSWQRWEFWLFSGVLSWGFVAFVEELFFRGYCQRRLAEDWGDGPAIVGVACLFTFAHGQYLALDAYNLSMVASLFVVATAFGVVFAHTRSLIPSVAAHAVMNVPMTPLWQGLFLAASVIGALVVARQGWQVVRRVFSGATVARCAVLAGIAMVFWVAARRTDGAGLAGAALVLLALAFEAIERSRARTVAPASQST
jgi:membrane protease YdiL (CAAX protease family)